MPCPYKFNVAEIHSYLLNLLVRSSALVGNPGCFVAVVFVEAARSLGGQLFDSARLSRATSFAVGSLALALLALDSLALVDTPGSVGYASFS